MFCQVFPPSTDLYAPSPHDELCRLFGSPVPTHTTDGSDGAIAMSPIVDTASLSKTGVHVVPLLVVFQTPPAATPTNTMFGLPSTTAKSSMRPPITAGPISRSSRFLSLSTTFGWSAGRASSPAISTAQHNPPAAAHFKTHDTRFMILSLIARRGIILRCSITRIFVSGMAAREEKDARCRTAVSSPATQRAKPMLGYPTYSIIRILRVNRHSHARIFSALQFLFPIGLLFLVLIFANANAAEAQQIRPPAAKGGIAELSAKGPQRRQGNLFIADDDVDIHYAGQRLRADHIEYNDQTTEALARGHVQYDFENQHLEAEEAHYNVGTGRGTFTHVRGTLKIERRPNPSLLVTDNPLYFEARMVERFGNDLYLIHQAWITVCDPRHPKWQFYAPRARVRVGKKMAIVNANFRLFRVPLIWMPYATAPAGSKIRQSGLLVPVAGNSTSKGFVFGDEFYWAPTSWMDTTLGAEYLSKRGSAERAQFRATPWENTTVRYEYFGVIDREHQGGHQQRLAVRSLLPRNWLFVTDANELSSLTFQLAFSPTYGEAINSDIRSSIFLTHNFRAFSFNLAYLNDRSFLNTNPQMSVILRNAPQARFGSVEQQPWRRLPFYFAFDAFAGAVRRDDNGFAPSPTYLPITTSNFVARTEFEVV